LILDPCSGLEGSALDKIENNGFLSAGFGIDKGFRREMIILEMGGEEK